MHNVNIPSSLELPSTAKLIKSTLIAAAAASVILITVVMPAEYGIDPTGVGSVLGLQKMGEIKASLAEEAAADIAQKAAQKAAQKVDVSVPPVSAPAFKAEIPSVQAILAHEMTVTLAANESTEIKLKMNKDQQATYSWVADKGQAFFDMHADSKELGIDYHVYKKGTEQQHEGVLIAAFDGSHGWYWKNRTSDVMTITLKTTGQYLDIQEMK